MGHSKKILGIDPGIARTGYGIVVKKGGRVEALVFGCVTTMQGSSIHKRFAVIYDELSGIIKKYKPDALALERQFFAKNVKTALTVGEARGVILLLAAKAGLTVYEYTPLEVKQALTGYGRAEKIQIQKMVRVILGLSEIPRPDDTADALAIALCAHQYRSREPL